MPSLAATPAACSGAAPPKAISVPRLMSQPWSAAWTRPALDMFSSTTSEMPMAATVDCRPAGSATAVVTALAAASGSNVSVPPAKRSGRSRPSTASASVTVGSVPPRPYAAGPGSEPALAGPTVIRPSASTLAIEPPPAPISTISITGRRSGSPLPGRNRYSRPTSNSRLVRGWPDSTMQSLAVVPPMSKLSARSQSRPRASSAASSAPPAGPLSINRTGKRSASDRVPSPPPDIMRNRSQPRPRFLRRPSRSAR